MLRRFSLWLILLLFDVRTPRQGMVKVPFAIAFITGCSAAVDLALGYRGTDLLRGVLAAGLTVIFFVVIATHAVSYLTELKAELAKRAACDTLTDLPNRRTFVEEVRQRLAGPACRDGLLAILDADHFKRVNDRYGHGAGDDCLRALARHLKGALQEGDLVARIGGEEFAVFLPPRPTCTEETLLRGLVGPVAVELTQEAASVLLTLSIGAVRCRPGDRFEMLMRQADHALYAAKAGGRGRLEVFTASAAAAPARDVA